MPKYYVAGIPFDSEDCLKHYGVKGMKWNQHIFGIDANDKYINWLKDAGQNIGKFANKAANTVGNAATSAARAVGGALNKSANFVTGNQARENADNASINYMKKQIVADNSNPASRDRRNLQGAANVERQMANVLRTSANETPFYKFNTKRNLTNAAIDTEKNAQNLQRQADDAAKLNNQVKREQKQDARDAYNQMMNAERAYERTLPGMVNTGMDAAGKAAINAARGAQGFLNSAGKWVSTAANDAKNWAGNAVNDVGKAANQAGQWIGDRAQDVGNAATNAWNGVTDAANQAGDWIGDRARDVGNVATDAWNGVSDAANQAGQWLGDRANEAGETIGNATKDAREWAGNAVNEVGKAAGSAVNAVGNAANDAGQWIGDRARETGAALGNAAESAKDWATNAVDDITGKNRARENHSNQMRDYASEVIDPSYSSRDREKILRDMISAEDNAISKGVANDRFFDGNTGGAIRNNLDMIDYLMNQIPNTPSSSQDKLYEYIEDLRNQNQMYLEAILGSKYPDGVRIRHSDISDKPEGVGETFWQNYIAHGGTREDYERDWR